MTPRAYDFQSQSKLPSSLERAVVGWFQGTSARLPKKCARHLPFPLEVAPRHPEVVRREEALARLSDAVVAHHVALARQAIPTLLVLPRPLALTLVNGLLGETEGALASDRDLTPVEESLYEFFLEDVLLPTLKEAWTGGEEEPVALGPKEPDPKWTRILPAGEDLLVGAFCFRGPFGEQEGQWLLPRKGLLGLLGSGEAEETAPPPGDLQPLLEAHVREMQVPLSVALGEARLPLSQLADLQPGDVIVFDQRITETLTVSVADKRKFHAWCGRVGQRHAFQVESLIEG